MSTIPKLPEVLEKIVDKVLAYHPKPKSKAAKKRKSDAQNAKVKKRKRPVHSTAASAVQSSTVPKP
jgi:hypothetical protein